MLKIGIAFAIYEYIMYVCTQTLIQMNASTIANKIKYKFMLCYQCNILLDDR